MSGGERRGNWLWLWLWDSTRGEASTGPLAAVDPNVCVGSAARKGA